MLAAIGNVFSLASKATGTEACTKYVLEDAVTEVTVNDDTMEPFYLVDGMQGDKLPDADYMLSDGRTLVVTDGKVSEVKDAAVDPSADTTTTTDPSTTAAADMTDPATEAQTLAQFALACGKTAADVTALARKHGVAIRMKADKLTRGKGQKLAQLKPGESLATLKDAVKLAAVNARESLSILFDPTSMKPMYVDQNSGSVSYVEDYGGYLYAGDYVPAGSYTLADGTVLVVIEKTEIYSEGTDWEWTWTESYVDFEASTVPIEVLVPWTKRATSEIAELAATQSTKLSAANTELSTARTEIAALKAQIAALNGNPATTPVVTPNGEALSDKNSQYAAMREGLNMVRKNRCQ